MTTDFRLDHTLESMRDADSRAFADYLVNASLDANYRSILTRPHDEAKYGLRNDRLVSYRSDKSGVYVSSYSLSSRRFKIGWGTYTGHELINFMKILRTWLNKTDTEPKKQSYDHVLLTYDGLEPMVFNLKDHTLEDAINMFSEEYGFEDADGIKVLFFNDSDMKMVTEERKYKLS